MRHRPANNSALRRRCALPRGAPFVPICLLLLALALTAFMPGCSAISREKRAAKVYREGCRKLLATPPWRDPFRPQGYIYTRPQRPSAAIRLLKKARNLDPHNPRYRLLLWWVLPEGDPRKAAEATWLANADGPEAASYHQALASGLLRGGRPTGV